jgi:hypothetical protein
VRARLRAAAVTAESARIDSEIGQALFIANDQYSSGDGRLAAFSIL